MTRKLVINEGEYMQKKEIIERAQFEQKLKKYDEAEQAMLGRGFLMAYNIAEIVDTLLLVFFPSIGEAMNSEWGSVLHSLIGMGAGMFLIGAIVFLAGFFRTRNKRMLGEALCSIGLAILNVLLIIPFNN